MTIRRRLLRSARALAAFSLPEPLILGAARALASSQPLGWCPGWRFGDRHRAPRFLFRLREQLWLLGRERELSHPLRLLWHDGLLIDIALGSDFSRCLFVAGVIDPNELTFLDRVLRPAMHFVDAGANLGLYSMFAAKRVGPQGRVTAFEPSPREHARLLHHLELNSIATVEVRRVALSNRTGRAQLQVSEALHEGQSTLGSFSHCGVSGEGVVEVPLETLDELASNGGWPCIDVIKIDVEGAEGAVLDGARRVLMEDRPLLLLELFDAALQSQGSSRAEVLAQLDSADYRVFHFHPTSGRLAPGDSGCDLNVVAIPRGRDLPPEVRHLGDGGGPS